MDARRIDLDTWPRREHFDHYRDRVACTHATTVELDVTRFVDVLARSPRKTYLAQVWAIASVVQQHDALRMTLVDGEPALWDVVHPAFTVLRPETETFGCVWVPYDADFGAFHAAAAPVLAAHRSTEGLFPMGPPPPNAFDVSSMPWTAFTGFTLSVRDPWDHLAPIVTLGRHVERDGRTVLPVALQIHHAAADGLHVARALESLQTLLAAPDWVDA